MMSAAPEILYVDLLCPKCGSTLTFKIERAGVGQCPNTPTQCPGLECGYRWNPHFVGPILQGPFLK